MGQIKKDKLKAFAGYIKINLDRQNGFTFLGAEVSQQK